MRIKSDVIGNGKTTELPLGVLISEQMISYWKCTLVPFATELLLGVLIPIQLLEVKIGFFYY